MIDFKDFEKLSYTSDDGKFLQVFLSISEDTVLGFIREVEGGFKARSFHGEEEVEFQNYMNALKYIFKTCQVVFPDGHFVRWR
mgnify:FL=1